MICAALSMLPNACLRRNCPGPSVLTSISAPRQHIFCSKQRYLRSSINDKGNHGRFSVAMAASQPDWTANLVTSDAEAARLAASFRTVAVLGIKTERQADQPAFYVAEYLASAGVKVVPVPVYYPDVTEILGQPIFRSVAAAAQSCGPLDCVDIFRRPSDVAGHLQDVLAAAPRVVWLQSGIRCPEAEEAWARAGIQVVSDKCLMVLHRRAPKL